MFEIKEQFVAQQILECLRQGTVPKQYAPQVMIGRTFWLDALGEDMDFVANGASKIRFLSAPYGGGKSHFLSAVEQIAIEKHFLVADVELHSREAPLDRFEIIFPKIMRSLICSSGTNVLEIVFNKWLNSSQLYDRQAINQEVRAISQSLDFQAALRAFVEMADSSYPEDEQTKQAVLGWLCGDAISPILRKHTHIRNKIAITNVSEIFGSFLRLVRRSGFSGVAILLDEAEAVTSLTQSRKRDEANQNIRKLLDNADSHEGLLIVFATTPSFLEDEKRGARSYPALWDRIKTVIKAPPCVQPNKRTLIIELEPPTKNELGKAAKFVLQLHSLAYAWGAASLFSDITLSKLVEKYLRTSPERVYRRFLRTLVGMLDSLEQAQGILTANGLVEGVEFEQ
ncbi:MAG: BREX system ATP-binding domain-containing protein [Candidatus Hodarchaeota archaeon]